MPAASSAVAWTNTSLSPLSGWMKPKPLAVLKNFTVPVVRIVGVLSHYRVMTPVKKSRTLGPATQMWGKATARRLSATANREGELLGVHRLHLDGVFSICLQRGRFDFQRPPMARRGVR